ncbi:MAG: aspartate carbamoyltransferase catalytic subunit [Phycisphaerales bacterium]
MNLLPSRRSSKRPSRARAKAVAAGASGGASEPTTGIVGAHALSGVMPGKDLINLADLEPVVLRRLLARSRQHAWALDDDPFDVRQTLKGQVAGLLFFEDSTRTRLSFAVAVQRLGGRFIELTDKGSSLSKGETLADTARTVEAMGVTRLVVRAKRTDDVLEVAQAVRIPVLNAGAGDGEHPTQGLLDTLALAEAHKRLDDLDLSGLTVLIVGDVARSRVARSSGPSMAAMGARVLVAGSGVDGSVAASAGGSLVENFEAALREADAVMALRIQHERGGSDLDAAGADAEYRERFGLTAQRADALKPGAVIMHPGPANPGVEIDAEVMGRANSIITRQVTLGVAVRMACLEARGAVMGRL